MDLSVCVAYCGWEGKIGVAEVNRVYWLCPGLRRRSSPVSVAPALTHSNLGVRRWEDEASTRHVLPGLGEFDVLVNIDVVRMRCFFFGRARSATIATRSSAQGNCSAKSRVAYVSSQLEAESTFRDLSYEPNINALFH